MMKSFSDFFNESKEAESKPSHEVDEMAIRHRPTGDEPEGSVTDHLDNELEYIGDERLREFVTSYLDEAVPEYFWDVAGAKNDIHHPKQDTGAGGLIRHTRMCCAVALELLENDLFKDLRDKEDELIAALICHDTIKNGRENKKYAQDHPTWAANNIKYYFNKRYNGDKGGNLASQVDFIANCVGKHMGPNFMWRKPFPLTKAEKEAGKLPGKILPAPDDKYTSFVHLCDYIASRQFIGDLSKFNDDYYVKKKAGLADARTKEAEYQERQAQKRSEREEAAEETGNA